MITLGSEREQNAVLDALDNPGGFSARTILFIGDDGENYGKRFSDGNWGQSDIAIGLECTLGGRLPRRLEGAETKLYTQVNGVLIPQMIGRSRSQQVGQSTTNFSAASWGAFLGEVKLRARVEYEGVPPEEIILDCLYRVADAGGYDKGMIEVDAAGTPILSFVGQEGFKPEETAADPLSRVLEDEQLPYVCRDTASGGNRTKLVSGLEGDVSRTFKASEMPNWLPPERADPQYSEVEVYREIQDGTDAYRVTANIIYFGIDDQPLANVVLCIPLNDETADGPANAQGRANEKAASLSMGLYKGTGLRLPHYYPLIECLDIFRILEMWRDDDGTWDREWLLQVDAYRHRRARSQQNSTRSQQDSTTSESPGYSTQVAHTATILREELLATPTLIVPRASSGVLQTLGRVVWSEASGFWFDSDQAANPEGQQWVGLDSTGAWIDEEAAEWRAGLDDMGFWFDFDI